MILNVVEMSTSNQGTVQLGVMLQPVFCQVLLEKESFYFQHLEETHAHLYAPFLLLKKLCKLVTLLPLRQLFSIPCTVYISGAHCFSVKLLPNGFCSM